MWIIHKKKGIFHNFYTKQGEKGLDAEGKLSYTEVANYLRKLGVEIEMGITTPFGALPVDKLINYNSTSWFFRLKGTDVYYFPGTYPKVASEIPYIYIKEERRICKIPRNK